MKKLKKVKKLLMPVFLFAHYEHEPFWSYLSRPHDYNQNFEKRNICEVIAVGLNVELRSYFESICPGGLIELLSKT